MSKDVTWLPNSNNIGYFDVELIQLDGSECEDQWEGEKWSLTGFKLKISRRYWRHIVNYYLASALFVILSWVSFLVPQDDVGSRIALLVTMLLVLVTVLNGVIDSSPNAREGPTALSFWMFSMVFFMTMSMFMSIFLLSKH